MALGVLDAGEIDSRQQHDQVRGADPGVCAAIACGWETIASWLQLLIPDRVAIFLPDKELDSVGGLCWCAG
jgi:hypothetical protein